MGITIYHKYNTPPIQKEKGGGESMTEIEGYVSSKDKIMSLISAGRRLVAARADQFDFPDGEDNGAMDPTREPNFDLADASMLYNDIQSQPPQEDKEEDREEEKEGQGDVPGEDSQSDSEDEVSSKKKSSKSK